MNAAVVHGLVSTNPVVGVRVNGKASKAVKTLLTREQLTTLLDGTADDRLGLLWQLIAMTGVRVSEALALTWADAVLDGDKPHIMVHETLVRFEGEWLTQPTKNKTRRTVPIDDVTAASLRRHRAHQGHPVHQCRRQVPLLRRGGRL